jgi:Transposase, Mutator family
MLPTVNTVVHLEVKVEVANPTINTLAEWAFLKREEIVGMLLRPLVQCAQEQLLAAVSRREGEMACTACGVLHTGADGWVRRGTRTRSVRTSSGEVEIALLQVTCEHCGKTCAPCMDALGLERRQRVTPELKRKLIERVFDVSYHKSVRTARDCMGVSVSASTLHGYVQEQAQRVKLTPEPGCETVIADGTRVRAGERLRGGKPVEHEDLRLAFQLVGRSEQGKRKVAHLRLIGIGVGTKTWPAVLPGDTQTKLVVTDGEPALLAHVRDHYPQARHQLCEWHIPHTIDWPLRKDGLTVEPRRQLQEELKSIIWGNRPQVEKRALYQSFIERLSFSPSTQTQLRQAAPYILYDEPSSERTTSLLERQMREVDRRVLVGVRWSVRGVRNLILLSMTWRHNPLDYARVWRQ